MIDYGLISNAIDYYDSQGFLRIETPWLVSKDIADLTKPLDSSTYIVQKDVETKQKAFVASGEQSFLYLINKGHMPNSGRYQTVTPCLRDDAWDTTHMKNFVKLELIEYNTDANIDDDARVKRMVDQAMGFFSKHVDKKLLTVVKIITKDAVSYDINLNDIEIGSYGYRKCLFCNWIYGTGIAEPRFSRLLKQTHGVY
jgi:hypothetical protein